MSLWKSVRDRTALGRQEDEAVHAAASDEFRSGDRRDGLWTKAIIEAKGDEQRTKAEYLRLLVSAIRDDIYLAKRAAEVSPVDPGELMEAGKPTGGIKSRIFYERL